MDSEITKRPSEAETIDFTSDVSELDSGKEQNLLMGIIGGAIAANIGAVIWAVITKITGYQIGWMAIGVGFLVGYAVKMTGNGSTYSFGVAGAVLALAGCIAGNMLAIAVIVGQMHMDTILFLMKKTFSPMDLVFYGLAVYAGFKYSVIEYK